MVAIITPCTPKGPNTVAYHRSRYYYIRDLVISEHIETFVSINGWQALLDDYENKWKEELCKIEETHAANIPLMEENKKTIEEIHEFMASKGIAKTFRKIDEKSRKSIKPYITECAGYVCDIGRVIKTEDNYQNAKQSCEGHIEAVRVARNCIQNWFKSKSDKEKTEKKKQNDLIVLGMANQMLGNPIVDILSHKNPHHAACDLIYCLIRQEPMLAFALAVQNCYDYRTCLEVESRLPEAASDQEKEVVDSIRKVISEFKDDGNASVFKSDRWRKRDVYTLVKEDVRKMYESLGEI